jgi:hypothetical protein
MGCNCGKKKVQPIPEPIPVPEHIKELTQEEIDWFNNIDEINPLNDDDDE